MKLVTLLLGKAVLPLLLPFFQLHPQFLEKPLGGHRFFFSFSSLPSHLLDPFTINDYFIDSFPNFTYSPEVLNRFSLLPCVVSQTFSCTPVTPLELFGIFRHIRFISSGLLDLSGRMLLLCLLQCLDPLLHILNYSFSCGTFPSSFKRSIVIPIPKVCNFFSLSSLRLISFPPFLLKLLEHKQFVLRNSAPLLLKTTIFLPANLVFGIGIAQLPSYFTYPTACSTDVTLVC